jgi:hypothetical protein
VLPDKEPVAVYRLGNDATKAITDALNELMAVLPDSMKGGVLSTIRSIEYRPGLEVQTIYAVGIDGTIQTEDRILEAQTVKPPHRLTRKEKIRLGIIGGVVAAIAVVALVLVFPYAYRKLFRPSSEKIAESLKVETGPYANIISVGKIKGDGKSSIKLELKRGKDWPENIEALEKMGTEGTFNQRLDAEDIARGRLLYAWFDKDDKPVGRGYIDITELWKNESTEASLSLPQEGRPASLKLHR